MKRFNGWNSNSVHLSNTYLWCFWCLWCLCNALLLCTCIMFWCTFNFIL